MKKVLLSSVAALAVFGTFQAVSAENTVPSANTGVVPTADQY